MTAQWLAFITALFGLCAIILKQVLSHRDLAKRLDNQDGELADIKTSVNNHLIHEIANISAKLDNLPCKVTPCSKN